MATMVPVECSEVGARNLLLTPAHRDLSGTWIGGWRDNCSSGKKIGPTTTLADDVEKTGITDGAACAPVKSCAPTAAPPFPADSAAE